MATTEKPEVMGTDRIEDDDGPQKQTPGPVLKSELDQLGVMATAWRFKKVRCHNSTRAEFLANIGFSGHSRMQLALHCSRRRWLSDCPEWYVTRLFHGRQLVLNTVR